MPVAQYNVRNYVTTSLQSLGIEVSDAEVDVYVKLIQKSVGCNPRAMKRLFNAFLLLNKIAANGTVIESAQRKMLFAILCLQLSFEEIYNYIVHNAEDCYDGNLLQSLTVPETYIEGAEAERLALELGLKKDADIINAVEFMTVFVKVLDKDADGSLTEKEIASFIDILLFSTITANTSAVKNKVENIEHDYRISNRSIIKEVLISLQGNYDKGPFKLYQTRTNNNPEWQKHYAGGWKQINTPFGAVNYEFKIMTNLQEKESVLCFYLYPADKTDRKKFVEHMQTWCLQQGFGFRFLEDKYGFRLDNKRVHADSRNEIIEYFAANVPVITTEIEKALQV